MPRVHQSTALVCPHPLITSGAIYSSVPTNEFVRKLAMQDLVSIVGSELVFVPFLPMIMVGFPPGSDCFDRSKSDSIMCPDWWRRMSSPVSKCQKSRGEKRALWLQISVDETHQVQILQSCRDLRCVESRIILRYAFPWPRL